MSNSALTTLVIIVAVIALLALGLALVSFRALRVRIAKTSSLPTDLEGLRAAVEGLRKQVGGGIQHLAVVRYDAFGDMGGRLSWSLAMLDGTGTGVVLTSIHGRSDERTYAKNVSSWEGEQQLSPEEDDAIKLARAS